MRRPQHRHLGTLVLAALAGALLSAPALAPATAAAATSCAVLGTRPAPADGWAAGPLLAQGFLGTAYDAGTSIAGSPTAFGWDTVSGGRIGKSIAVPYNTTPDNGSEKSAQLVSTNAGWSFGAPAAMPQPIDGVVQLRDGTYLGLGFLDGGTIPNLTMRAATWDGTSTASDGTPAWVPVPGGGVIDLSAPSWLRLAGNPVQLPDGTILVPAYGQQPTDTHTRVYVFAGRETVDSSGNAGFTTFTVRDTVAGGSGSLDFNETALALAVDGSLLAVMRTADGIDRDDDVLYQGRSTDGGQTWGPVGPLMFDDSTTPAHGVDPQLALMPDGIMVLSSGRPADWVAMSSDGLGDGWQQEQTTYDNTPASGTDCWYGSGGYTGIVPLGGSRLLQVFDNCKPPGPADGCTKTGVTYPNGIGYAIERRILHAATDDAGRIDLAGKLASGAITLAAGTDMNRALPGHPTAIPAAPLYESTSYWTSAVSSTASGVGTYVLHLDRDYDLTRIGLALRPGVPATAQVLTSEDGVFWSPPAGWASADWRSPGDFATRYRSLAGTRASWIRIVTDPTGSCDPEFATDNCSMLHGLELYSTIDSFEDDPAGGQPRGYLRGTMAWATDSAVTDGTRQALRVKDTSTGEQARISAPRTVDALADASLARTLEFSLDPTYCDSPCSPEPSPFVVTIDQVTGTGRGPAYELAANPDGSISAYSSTTQAWSGVAAAGTVQPPGSWTRLRVAASTNGAYVYVVAKPGVDGQPAQATLLGALPAPPAGTGVINGYTFASAGTKPVGSDFVIDDVSWSAGTSFALASAASGRCLDADTNTLGADGTVVQLWDCFGGVEQRWSRTPVSGKPGWFTIQDDASGRCLDADLGTIGGNGTKVQLWDCTGGSQQQWSFDADPSTGGNGAVHNGDSPRCLDADPATIGADGTTVRLWDCTAGASQQQWRLG